ncbi:hypothetical protein [Paenarthrobacter sp. NPDC091669]|uniref:hypothetical protein n=1 Tax=Paenarthrobacter sp. NPDC091669 TaxID=3364384 RepID=UPI0037F50067
MYSGRHEAIVSQELFDQVQAVMAARSGAGQRDRVYDHVLKGMIFCKKFERRGRTSRVIFTKARGRGNTIHEFFFCRSRQDGDCDLRYVPGLRRGGEAPKHLRTPGARRGVPRRHHPATFGSDK